MSAVNLLATRERHEHVFGEQECRCGARHPCEATSLADEVAELRSTVFLQKKIIEQVDRREKALREALEKVVTNLENEPYTFSQKYSEQALKIARAALAPNPPDEPVP